MVMIYRTREAGNLYLKRLYEFTESLFDARLNFNDNQNSFNFQKKAIN